MMNPIAADAVHQYWWQKNTAAADLDSIARACDAARVAGMSAFAFHGGPRGQATRWDKLARVAADHGQLAVSASGLDGARDTDGTALTPTEKGAALGDVLARPSCVLQLADAEGEYDSDKGPTDTMDEGGALRIGEALRTALARAGVPDKPCGDQLWFAIKSHGGARAVPKPIAQGGPFAGFPADEFALRAVNTTRWRQLYINNVAGANRYAHLKAWMESDWAWFNAMLDRTGFGALKRPLGVTIQGYGWRDIVWDLVACLLEFCVQKQQPVFVWGEPNLAPETYAAIRAVHALRREGFALDGGAAAPATIVTNYQRAYNLRAPQNRRLVVDGKCGVGTMATLGITL